MDFNELNQMIPYATGAKNHTVSMTPYNGITLSMPGRHQNDTTPVGGDFVVMVTDSNVDWTMHQFTHGDLWDDMERKFQADPMSAKLLMRDYAIVVRGTDPHDTAWDFENGLISEDLENVWDNTLRPQTFLYAVQCLAVAEHRRYWQFEKDGGGRYLPARFSIGIVEGIWTSADCKEFQYRGRQGLENLIKLKGRPTPLKKYGEA
jgi:hypothetical protein